MVTLSAGAFRHAEAVYITFVCPRCLAENTVPTALDRQVFTRQIQGATPTNCSSCGCSYHVETWSIKRVATAMPKEEVDDGQDS